MGLEKKRIWWRMFINSRAYNFQSLPSLKWIYFLICEDGKWASCWQCESTSPGLDGVHPRLSMEIRRPEAWRIANVMLLLKTSEINLVQISGALFETTLILIWASIVNLDQAWWICKRQYFMKKLVRVRNLPNQSTTPTLTSRHPSILIASSSL